MPANIFNPAAKPKTGYTESPDGEIAHAPSRQLDTPVSNLASSNELNVTYYHDNFNTLLRFVTEHYQSLLTTEEHRFLQSYRTLSVNAQQLFVRLVLRTLPLLRLSKITYPDIDVPVALQELDQSGFINSSIDCIEHCLPLFSKPELSYALGRSIVDLSDIDSIVWTTPDLLGDSPVTKLFASDSVIEVNYKQTILIFRLLFFGNLYQDFSSFVLRDLGFQRFEPYHIDHQTLFFKTREQISAHLECHQCAEAYDTACDAGVDALLALHNAMPERIHTDSVLCRRIDRLDNKIARQLERESALDIAATIYSKALYPPARERLARIFAKSDKPEEALALCKQITEQPLDCEELDFATHFGQSLGKKLNRPFPLLNKYQPPETVVKLPLNNLSVEFSAATYLAITGKCYYLENSLISGMFGLAFWDIIFAPVNGVFFHPFQNAPADFYKPEFSESRKDLINARLDDISRGKLKSIVNTHLYHKRGTQNPMVNWRMCRKHVIDLALRRIPPDHWCALFTQLLTDIRNYRSGQPDLVNFPDAGGYQLIEVKAPGDKLQKNQLRWMRFFNQYDIPHLVMNVEWTDTVDETL